MPDIEQRKYPIHLPQDLCDGLAIRADTLPFHMKLRIRAFVNSSEGRIAGISEKILNWREHPTLDEEKIDGWLAEQNLTREDFRRQYAPELAFLQTASELDSGLCRAAELYLAAPSPRSEQERLNCVVKNRGKSCPGFLESFLLALPLSDLHIMTDRGAFTQRDGISQRGRWALEIIETRSPETKEILAESYALEIQLVKDCMALIDLEQEAFVRQIRESLREYASVRPVERTRLMAW